MNKVILVIGSVTAKQYEPVRLDFISRGDKPRIVRLRQEEFILDEQELYRRYGTDEMANANDGTTPEEMSKAYLYWRQTQDSHLSSVFRNVDCVIMDEAARRWCWTDRGELFPYDIGYIYELIVGDNGESFLQRV